MLYFYPEATHGMQCSVPVPPEHIQQVQEELSSFEIDEFLPPGVLAWCQQTLATLKFDNLDGRQVNDAGQRRHRLAYIDLREQAHQHILEGFHPFLTESEKPYNARHWFPPQGLQNAVANAGVALIDLGANLPADEEENP
jgi:hypothetical protein